MPGQTRGMVRPPSLDPAQVAPLDAHEQYAPIDSSPDARLLNLERQTSYDHSYFMNVRTTVNQIIDFMKCNEERAKEGVRLGIDMRRELYKVRDDVPGIINQKLNDLRDGIPVLIDQKLHDLNAKLPDHIRHITESVIVPVIDQKIEL